MLPIYKKLKSNTELAQYLDVEKQVFEHIAPQDTPTPYIVWQTLSGQAQQHLDAPANFDDTQYQIMVYDTDPKRAYKVREMVRRELEQYSWILNPSLGHYEPKTKLVAKGFDANWILERSEL